MLKPSPLAVEKSSANAALTLKISTTSNMKKLSNRRTFCVLVVQLRNFLPISDKLNPRCPELITYRLDYEILFPIFLSTRSKFIVKKLSRDGSIRRREIRWCAGIQENN